jgi:hypothetical protein
MSYLREALGDRFDAYVKRGGDSQIYGQPCRELDREELLAALEVAMEQYTASVEGHNQTRRMYEMFDKARKQRNGDPWDYRPGKVNFP